MTEKSNSGFTLLEILVGMAVGVVAGGLLVSILVQSNGVFLKQGVQVSEGLSLNQSISEINADIVQSSGVVSSYPVSGQPQYTTGANVLVLQVPSINSSGNVISNVYDYIVISADTQKKYLLREMVFPDAQSSRKSLNKILSTSLNYVIFYYFDSHSATVSPLLATKINYSIVLNEKVGLGTKVASSSSVANLRNK